MWMRYPGRLAHLEDDSAPIVESGLRVGTSWRSRCGRQLRVFFDDRPWQASSVDVFDLRVEQPRGWCLRCAYWAARDALVIASWDYTGFVREVEMGRWPVTVGAAA